MEELVQLLPRWLVAAVLVPFFVGVTLLVLLVEPDQNGQAFVFLLFMGGMFVFVLIALGLTLSIRQSRGLERQPGDD
jgi:hypothetical protein